MLKIEKVFTRNINKLSLEELYEERDNIIDAREGFQEMSKNGLWLDDRYIDVDNRINELKTNKTTI